MNIGKGFKKFCERRKEKNPVCECSYGKKEENLYGKCYLKGKDGYCYLKYGKNCIYAK